MNDCITAVEKIKEEQKTEEYASERRFGREGSGRYRKNIGFSSIFNCRVLHYKVPSVICLFFPGAKQPKSSRLFFPPMLVLDVLIHLLILTPLHKKICV